MPDLDRRKMAKAPAWQVKPRWAAIVIVVTLIMLFGDRCHIDHQPRAAPVLIAGSGCRHGRPSSAGPHSVVIAGPHLAAILGTTGGGPETIRPGQGQGDC